MDKVNIKENRFGYPPECNKCQHISLEQALTIKGGYYKVGTSFRLMIVGQDPTIRTGSKVSSVLMLNDSHSNLYKWLSGMIGDDFNNITIYATNLVKCTFKNPPSGKKNLTGFFKLCRQYLIKEIVNYQPNLLLTLGEPAHQLFLELIKDKSSIRPKMKDAIKEGFHEVEVNGTRFIYSPSLHITTYRVADTYGKTIQQFKDALRKSITNY